LDDCLTLWCDLLRKRQSSNLVFCGTELLAKLYPLSERRRPVRRISLEVV
jgi:hypothetical protein